MDTGKFRKYFYALLAVYFVVQILIVLFSELEYQSDSLGYYQNAVTAIEAGSIYPSAGHMYSDYIIAPLFINLLVIILSLWNSFLSIAILNILLVWLQIFLIYLITSKLFDERAAFSAVIIFVLYLNNLGFILLNMTEPLFNVLLLASLYYYLRKTKLSLFLSGIFAAASLAVRPIGIALIAALLIIPLVDTLRHKKTFNYSFNFAAGVILFLLFFGSVIYISFGQFIVTSTNGPINLLIGANDNATGAFNNKVFDKGNAGYIEQSDEKTYIEKQQHWGDQAYIWIRENPLKWISIIPMKLAHIFLWDDYAVSVLVSSDWNLYKTSKAVLSGDGFEGIMPGSSIQKKIGFLSLQFIHHLYYYFLLVVFLIGVYRYFRKNSMAGELRILLMFILFGLLINMLSFGDPRFKYPYLIVMIIFISPRISKWLKENKHIPQKDISSSY